MQTWTRLFSVVGLLGVVATFWLHRHHGSTASSTTASAGQPRCKEWAMPNKDAAATRRTLGEINAASRISGRVVLSTGVLRATKAVRWWLATRWP